MQNRLKQLPLNVQKRVSEENNLIALCRECHADLHAEEKITR